MAKPNPPLVPPFFHLRRCMPTAGNVLLARLRSCHLLSRAEFFLGSGQKCGVLFLKHVQHIHGLGRCLSEKKFLAVWPRSVGMCAQSAPRTSSKVPHVRTHRWTIICIVSTAHSQGSDQSLLAQASVSVNPRVRTKLAVWGSCDGDRASAIDI